MKPGKLGYVLGATVLITAIALMSCGHDRKLVSIAVEPPAATFGAPDPDAQILFTALGTFIHPPDTRDLTAQATWKSDVPQIVTVNGGVVSPTGTGCGIANISASMNDGGNLVIGFATVTVDDTTNPNCPGGSNTLGVVTVTTVGSGTVSSVPAGISCPSTCGAQFTVGNTVILTATPAGGHSFVSWGNCPGAAGNTCPVLVGIGSINVTATFN